ncbi:MAG: hypothetical protein QM602_04330, partial [Microbacterium sp.]
MRGVVAQRGHAPVGPQRVVGHQHAGEPAVVAPGHPVAPVHDVDVEPRRLQRFPHALGGGVAAERLQHDRAGRTRRRPLQRRGELGEEGPG